jgi:hypothetical protein
MVAELHLRGYQKMRISLGVQPLCESLELARAAIEEAQTSRLDVCWCSNVVSGDQLDRVEQSV